MKNIGIKTERAACPPKKNNHGCAANEERRVGRGLQPPAGLWEGRPALDGSELL